MERVRTPNPNLPNDPLGFLKIPLVPGLRVLGREPYIILLNSEIPGPVNDGRDDSLRQTVAHKRADHDTAPQLYFGLAACRPPELQKFVDAFNRELENHLRQRYGDPVTDAVLYPNGLVVKDPYKTFRAIFLSVQEDAVLVWNKKTVAVHVHSPSRWRPADIMGKGMEAIHEDIPGANTVPYGRIWSGFMKSPKPLIRYNYSFSDSTVLNQHPDRQIGRTFAPGSELYIRVERQVFVTFPEHNGLAFIIRTYNLNSKNLNREQKELLLTGLRSYTPAQLKYKGIEGKTDIIASKLGAPPTAL